MFIRNKPDTFSILNSLFLLFFAFACILPFYYVIIVSFSDPLQIKEGEVTLFPRGFSTLAYQLIFRQRRFFNAFTVTVLRTALGTSINLAAQCGMAYALAKNRIRGRKTYMLLVVFTFLFHAGIIPTYLIVRATGIMDSIWALVLPLAVNPMFVIILTSFFTSIPSSIEESAKIDGANDLVIFFRLVIPLSMPAISTITLFLAVFHWNSLMDGVIYINSERLKPLQVFLMDMVMRTRLPEVAQSGDEMVPTISIQNAAIFLATFPILLVYPYIQKHFVKGIMIGAIKG